MDMKDTLLAVSGLLGGSGGGGSGGPLITQQPSDVSGEIGVTVHFSVTASGTGLTYMWQSNMYEEWRDTSFSTSTTATLALKVSQERDGVQYRCKVTDGEGHVVYSHPATLRVAVPEPVIITKTITENGTYAASSDNADGYSEVTVDVPSKDYDANDFLIASKPTGVVTSNATAPGYVGCITGRTRITELNFPEATELKARYFQYCASLRKIYAPKAAVLGQSCLVNDYGLVTLVLHNLRNVSGNDACNGCTNMTTADFGGTYTSGNGIANYCFNGCTSFDTLVLRSSTVWALQNISAFQNSKFASGKAGGTLYVPSALISSYQSATNWSTILGYATNSIQAIEGSIYETQYADGTPIS